MIGGECIFCEGITENINDDMCQECIEILSIKMKGWKKKREIVVGEIYPMGRYNSKDGKFE